MSFLASLAPVVRDDVFLTLSVLALIDHLTTHLMVRILSRDPICLKYRGVLLLARRVKVACR